MTYTREKWRASLPQELDFWDSVITGRFPNPEYVKDFADRAAGRGVFPSHLAKYLAGKILSDVSVLDVGSGAHTNLFPMLDGRRLHIKAVDPLAREYNEIIDRHGVSVVVRTDYAEAEQLHAHLGEERFDLVHARNSLDHSYDPAAAFQQMLNVCKPGGIVHVEGGTNEAVQQNFEGLHQWNFMPVAGDLVIWGNDERYMLSQRIKDYIGLRAYGDSWYKVVLVKDWN